MANPVLCKIECCDKPARNRGWCSAHYERWRRAGDPGGALGTSPGDPMRFYLEEVLPSKTSDCIYWPYTRNNGGYGQLWSDGKVRLVTRMICETLFGPPPTAKHVAAHSCGNGHLGCVSPQHVSWKTHKENSADALTHGTRLRGERAREAKLTEADVRYIRSVRGRVSQKHLAIQFGIHQSQISLVQRGKNWGWLE